MQVGLDITYKHSFVVPEIKASGTIELNSKLPDAILKQRIKSLLSSSKNSKISGTIKIDCEEYKK